LARPGSGETGVAHRQAAGQERQT
jgi:hypothetical protein